MTMEGSIRKTCVPPIQDLLQTNGFQDFLQAGTQKNGSINLLRNAKEARDMNPIDFVLAVGPTGKWDYKNDKLASKNQDMIGGQNMLQRFGNFHFGYVAAANDFTLAESMAGAGLVQHFLQDGNPINTPVLDKILDQVTDVSSEDAEEAEYLTHAGYEWFDNAGDAADILDGWNFYHEQERKN